MWLLYQVTSITISLSLDCSKSQASSVGRIIFWSTTSVTFMMSTPYTITITIPSLQLEPSNGWRCRVLCLSCASVRKRRLTGAAKNLVVGVTVCGSGVMRKATYMDRDDTSATRKCVPGLVRLLVEAELIVHIPLRICDCVNGGRGVVIRRAVWLVTTKDICGKRIMIGRNCGSWFGFISGEWLECIGSLTPRIGR